LLPSAASSRTAPSPSFNTPIPVPPRMRLDNYAFFVSCISLLLRIPTASLKTITRADASLRSCYAAQRRRYRASSTALSITHSSASCLPSSTAANSCGAPVRTEDMIISSGLRDVTRVSSVKTSDRRFRSRMLLLVISLTTSLEACYRMAAVSSDRYSSEMRYSYWRFFLKNRC